MNDQDYWFTAEARFDAQVKEVRARNILALGKFARLATGPWPVPAKPRVAAVVRNARKQAHLSRMLRSKFDRSSALRAHEEANRRREKDRQIEIDLEYGT